MPDTSDEPRSWGERSQALFMQLSAEEIGCDGSYVFDPEGSSHVVRVTYSSRAFPARTAGLELASETLGVWFFIDRRPDLKILTADDYEAAEEGYTEARVREMERLVAAFLRGMGSVEPRRTITGWRARLRLDVDGREWIAR